MALNTLAALRAAAIDEADAGTDPTGFEATAGWNRWINSAISYVYGMLVQKYGQNYYYHQLVIPGVIGKSSYPLPDGTLYSAAPAFYKLIGVDIALDNNGSNWQNAIPYQIKQRNMFTQGYVPIAVVSPWYQRYQLQGNNINWIPSNTAPGPLAFRLNYIPQPPTLVMDADTFDGIAGYEELVVIEAAIRFKDKEESDTTVLMARRADWYKRIQDEADDRDAAEPLRMVDAYQRGGFGWNGGNFGGGVW